MGLWRFLYRTFFESAKDRAEREEFWREMAKPIPTEPPPLPTPKTKYVLYSQGDGCFDIDDGGKMVGWISKAEGDEEHFTVYGVHLGGVSFDFRTLKAAKEWLGKPPVRQYR